MRGVPRGDAVALTRALVGIDSRNPSLGVGGPGEAECATTLATILRDWGFRVELTEVTAGRPNVIVRLGAGSKSILLNGHLDTVGVEGMTHPPFEAAELGGRIYGRGSSDMKAGIAAMCVAALRHSDAGGDGGEIIIAAVIDEEYESLGTRALLASGLRADAAIITEPTRLAVCPAHRGFVWMDITVTGRAAHGSRYDIGVDAITNAGLLLADLDLLETTVLPSRSHPLLGRPSLHASTISGGTGMSTYPAQCELSIERRTIPGESAESVLAEVRDAIARIAGRRPGFDAMVSLRTAQPPSDVASNAPVVEALRKAITAEDRTPRIEGLSAWTDAALFNDAGIPAVCFGPGDISLAHAAEEFVEIEEIHSATAVLTRTIANWLS